MGWGRGYNPFKLTNKLKYGSFSTTVHIDRINRPKYSPNIPQHNYTLIRWVGVVVGEVGEEVGRGKSRDRTDYK